LFIDLRLFRGALNQTLMEDVGYYFYTEENILGLFSMPQITFTSRSKF